MRLAALARQQADFEGSLKLINGLLERHDVADNMRFRYHRGWTLTGLGRFDEAIADFTEGIKVQPDYPYAYRQRACAHASVGNLPFALSDLETYTGLMAGLPQVRGSRAVAYDIARATEIKKRLRAAIEAGKSDPTSDPCEGFWSAEDKPRKRSPLLPPA